MDRQDILEKVKLLTTPEVTFDKLVKDLAEEEIARRGTLLTKAIVCARALETDINRIRPDLVSYDANGQKVNEAYSRDRINERRKLQEELTKVDRAIEKALNEADYSQLESIKTPASSASSSSSAGN